MKYNPMTRRHFLQGLGGFTLALPYLPSLFPTIAHAAEAQVLPAFFYITAEHGGVHPVDIYGSLLGYNETPPSALTSKLFMKGGVDMETGKSFPDHTIHYGALSDYLQTAKEAGESEDPDNGQNRLSFIVGAGFNSYLAKMNLLRGLDHHWVSHGHGQGMLLGNFRAIQNGPKDLLPIAASIDTVLANSSKFYPNLSGVTLKQFVSYTGRVASFDGTGAELPPSANYTDDLFNKIFNGNEASNPETTKKISIIDKVLEDYKRFISPATSTGRRISSEDRQSYERFISHLNEVDRRLNSSASCTPGNTPVKIRMKYDWPRHEEIWQITAEIMALAFSCGACRLGTAHLDGRFLIRNSSYASDYHQAIAHQAAGADIARTEHRRYHRVAMQEAYLTMIKTLDSYSGINPGTTVLDQSLVAFQPQAGLQTHKFFNNFALTAGGAAGKLNTGTFIDFRNKLNLAFGDGRGEGAHPGLAQNQFLATVLQAMGLSPSDYEDPAKFGGPAYGGWHVDKLRLTQNGHIGMPKQLLDQSGKPLPVWWKG